MGQYSEHIEQVGDTGTVDVSSQLSVQATRPLGAADREGVGVYRSIDWSW